jgi:hypothetical protein
VQVVPAQKAYDHGVVDSKGYSRKAHDSGPIGYGGRKIKRARRGPEAMRRLADQER